MKNLIEKISSDKLISFWIANFIFLWSFSFAYFQSRFLIAILIIPVLIKLFEEIKLNNYKNFFTLLLINLILVAHYFINYLEDKTVISLYSLKGLVFFNIIFAITLILLEKNFKKYLFFI